MHHSLTHSFTHSFTHPFTPGPTCSLIHSLLPSLPQSTANRCRLALSSLQQRKVRVVEGRGGAA